MDALAIVGKVKSLSCKVLAIGKLEVWNIDATLACYLILMVFLQSHVFRIVCVTEFYKPMSFCV